MLLCSKIKYTYIISMPSSSDYILSKRNCAIQGCGCNSNPNYEHCSQSTICELPGPSSSSSYNNNNCRVGPMGPTGPPGPPGSSSSTTITNNINTDAEYFPVFSTTYSGSFKPYTSNTKLMYNPANGNLITHGFYVQSDKNALNSITPIDPIFASELLQKLNPVSYKITGQSPGLTHYGFVGQEIDNIVSGKNLAVVYNTRGNQTMVSPIELIAPLIATINSLSKKVEELTERIEKIENTTYMCNRKTFCQSCSK
jgi:hypothetical protein